MASANRGNGQPTEMTIEGVTLVFGRDIPPARSGGSRGDTKYDRIVEAIRESGSTDPIFLQGVKPSAASVLKKKYADVHFMTRGGKENPQVWAQVKSPDEELVSS